MGADKHEKRRRERLAPFVPVHIAMLEAPAWVALSHGAKALYIALKRRYSSQFHNNGRLFLSFRDASRELRSGFAEIARWYRELEHYGFIVKVTPGTLGIEGRGKAPRWRLTELGCNREAATHDYKRWNGTKFTDAKKKSRCGNPQRGAAESNNTSATETRSTRSPKRCGFPQQVRDEGVTEIRSKSRLPSLSPSDARCRHSLDGLDQEDDFDFEERAAFLEYDGGYSRDEAEAMARAELVAVKQTQEL